MKNPLRRQTITFVVRVWVEYLDQDPPCWRGEIEQAGKGRSMYFSDLGELTEMIRKLASASAARTCIYDPHTDLETGEINE